MLRLRLCGWRSVMLMLLLSDLGERYSANSNRRQRDSDSSTAAASPPMLDTCPHVPRYAYNASSQTAQIYPTLFPSPSSLGSSSLLIDPSSSFNNLPFCLYCLTYLTPPFQTAFWHAAVMALGFTAEQVALLQMK